LQDVQSLPFFSDLPFAGLRQISAPFVPVLDGETDVGYFDSFSSPEDMAKYAEVFKKQKDVEAVEENGSGNRNNWVGHRYFTRLPWLMRYQRSVSLSVVTPM